MFPSLSVFYGDSGRTNRLFWFVRPLRSLSLLQFAIRPFVAVLVLLVACAASGRAQTGTVTSAPSGPVAVGSSANFVVTFNFSGLTYVYGADYLTNGSYGEHVTYLFGPTTTFLNSFAEYTFGGTTCTGSSYGADGFPGSCTVTVTFTPKVPGARPGAVIIQGNYNGDGSNIDSMPPLAFVYLNGTATGPQAVFATGALTNAVTGLTSATAVAADGNGDLYFTDQSAKTLSKLAFGSSTPTVLVSNINAATGVAVDGVGNIFYGSYSDNKVYKIPYNGGTTTSISVTSPDIGMAVDSNSNVYVAGASSVSKIAANATTSTNIATLSNGDSVPAVTVDAAGDVFFSDFTASKIYKVPFGTTTATALTTVDGSGTNELSGPRGIAIDGGGNLYVANQTAHKILRLINGTWTQNVVTSGSSYSGLAMDISGALYMPLGTDIVKDTRSTVSLTYTPIVVSTNSAQQAVTLENDGTSSLTISSLSTGTTNANTGGAATTCSTSTAVAAGANCVLGVRFAPTQVSTTSGTVTITDNSNPTTQAINLTGSTANDPQTITFVQTSAAAPNTTATLLGSASSGLTVSYSIVSGPATINSNGTSITYTGLGTVVIQATQAGNVNYAAATPVNSSVLVTAPPVITFAPASTNLVGNTVTLTATSNQSATPITFSIISGTATLSGSQLTFTSSGTLVVAANQAGTANYPPGQTQATIQVYISQTINFSPTTPVPPGTVTQLSGSATSNLPVSYAVTSGPATIAVSGNTYTITYNAVGTVVITASQAGNGTYAPAPNVQQSVAVVARPIISFTPATPVALGSSATLSATSTQSASPIIFSIFRGTATLSGSSITYTYAEPVTIQANQAGTSNYPAALPVNMTVYVTGATATTSLAITVGGHAATTATAGSAVTLTATVSAGGTAPAQGQVTFCDAPTASACSFLNILGTSQLRSGANAGTAIYRFTPGVGPHNFFAIFGPSATYAKSVSTASAFSVDGSNTGTVISQSGSAGNYTLTGTVIGTLGAAPADTLNFVDQTNSYSPLASAPLIPGSSSSNYVIASNPAMNGGPTGVVTADFDGDGILDLATANQFINTVSVLKGSGAGSFTLISSPSTGSNPNGIATGDFNGDGIPDLAVTNQGDNTVTILLGNGDGTFTTKSTPGTSYGPVGVTVADFNGDGIADLAVVGYSNIDILLGNGDGTFTGGASFGNDGIQIVTADFNGDGIADLAITVGNTNIYLGRGDGTFIAVSSLSNGAEIAVGDFNGDGKTDIVVQGSSIFTYLGNGDGTFALQPNPLPVPGYGSQLGVTILSADFNGDGIADIAYEERSTSNSSSNSVVILQGKGDGTFSPSPALPIISVYGAAPGGIAVGDFNGDRLPDVVGVALNFNDYSGTPPYTDYSAVYLSSAGATSTATVTGVNPTGSGTHYVAAIYPGDSVYTPSLSTPTALTASTLQPNTITFPQPTSPAPLNGTAVLGATSTTGTVTYTVTAGTATLSGSTITYTTGGTVQITANSPATSTYAAATPVTVTVVVSLPQASLTWLPSTLSIYTGTALSTNVLDATDTIPATIGYSAYLLANSSSSATTVTATSVLTQGTYGLIATVTPTNNSYGPETLTLPFTVQNMNAFIANGVGTVASLYNNGTPQSNATSGGGIGAAVDSAGFVWSIDHGGSSVSKFTNAGALSTSYSGVGLTGATALAIDGNGQVWATNSNNTISVLSTAGAAVSTTSDPSISGPTGVAVDTSGNVWISNSNTNTVDEILGDAAPTETLAVGVQGTPGVKP